MGRCRAELESNGYAVIETRDLVDFAALSRCLESARLPASQPFSASLRDRPPAPRRSVDSTLRHLLDRSLDDVLSDVVALFAGFVMKGALFAGWAASEFPLHQDLTFTDERIHRSGILWVPCVDINERSGRLLVVPGSHRWSSGIRPAGSGAGSPLSEHEARLRELAVALEVPRGCAVVWDAALIHGSEPNRTGATRPVASLAWCDRGADPVIYFVGSEGQLRGYPIDDDFLDLPDPLLSPPVGEPSRMPFADMVRSADFSAHLPDRVTSRSSIGSRTAV